MLYTRRLASYVPKGKEKQAMKQQKAMLDVYKRQALVPAIMEAIRINDFRLYREITDGKSITCMIAGLNLSLIHIFAGLVPLNPFRIIRVANPFNKFTT